MAHRDAHSRHPARRVGASGLFARIIGVVLVAHLVGAWGIGQPKSLFEDQGAIASAIAELIEKFGPMPRVLSIRVDERQVEIEAQDRTNPRHINRYGLRRIAPNKIGVNWEKLSGPTPVQLNLTNPNIEQNLFNLADVNIGVTDLLIREAIEQTALEDKARVIAMEISRQVYLLPKPSNGDIVWTVRVASERENASVAADKSGAIVSLDLSQTLRAKELNLLARPELLAEAAKAFEAKMGRDAILTRVGIGSHGKWVSFETNLGKAGVMKGLKQVRTASWDLSGLKETLGSVDMGSVFGAKPAFRISDPDWSTLGALITAAKSKLGMADGTASDVALAINAEAVSPALEWTIEITSPTGDEGRVRFDVAGAIVGVALPEGAAPAFDGRSPTVWRDAPRAIAASLGAETPITEITLRDDRIEITARDPKDPTSLASFSLTAEGLSRAGGPGLFMEEVRPFKLQEIEALSADQLRSLIEKTAKRLGFSPEKVVYISIGRGAMDPSPEGRVTVEVRMEEKPFGKSGRVCWEIDGREVKAYLP